MKTYLVEFENLVTSDPYIEIIGADNDEAAWWVAFEESQRAGLSQGNFSMYCLLRNPNGYLYLADLVGNAIKSNGGTYLV